MYRFYGDDMANFNLGNILGFLRTDKTQSADKVETVNFNNQNVQNSDEVLFDETPKIKNDNFICVEKYGIPSSDETPTIIYKPINPEYFITKYGYPNNPPIILPDTPDDIIVEKYGFPDIVGPEIPIIEVKYGIPDIEEPDQPPVYPEIPEEPELPVKPEPFEPIITKYGFPEFEEPDLPPVEPEVPVEPETPETPDEPKPSEWETATLPKKLNMVMSMMDRLRALRKDENED